MNTSQSLFKVALLSREPIAYLAAGHAYKCLNGQVPEYLQVNITETIIYAVLQSNVMSLLLFLNQNHLHINGSMIWNSNLNDVMIFR